MPFNELLDRKIKESGMTVIEIAEKCKEYGSPVTKGYLSTLRNTPGKTTSEELCRALAKALKLHEDLFVLEMEYDKAPQSYRTFIEKVRAIVIVGAIQFAKNPEETKQLIERAYNSMSAGEFIIYLAEAKN